MVYRDRSWLKGDIDNIKAAGIQVTDIDISVAPKADIVGVLEAADAICFGGGNAYFLLDWVRRSGIDKLLPNLLERRVYMGISAGSMIAGPSIETNTPFFPEEDEGKIEDLKGLCLVPWAVVPHLNSPSFPQVRDERVQSFASSVHYPVVALDDASALEVLKEGEWVVSTGEYRMYSFSR
jgi:dipeptidase E